MCVTQIKFVEPLNIVVVVQTTKSDYRKSLANFRQSILSKVETNCCQQFLARRIAIHQPNKIVGCSAKCQQAQVADTLGILGIKIKLAR